MQGCLNKTLAIQHIQAYASQHIEATDQQKFIEVVETQLLSLHEGSIARYRLKPGEFHT